MNAEYRRRRFRIHHSAFRIQAGFGAMRDFAVLLYGILCTVAVALRTVKRMRATCSAQGGKRMDSYLSRITYDQRVLRGKPVIRGMRISVEMILELIAKGAKQDEILEDYPQLEPEDLQAALLYAHHLVAGETVVDRLAA